MTMPTAAIGGAMRVAHEVLEDEEVVQTGIVNGNPLVLPAGTYRIRVLGSPVRDLGEVTVESGAAEVLDAG
jgi:glutamate-1-semialdehyde aminotransferase